MSDKPNITILNVDDHDDSRYAVSEIVRYVGFEAMEASSGTEALRAETNLAWEFCDV